MSLFSYLRCIKSHFQFIQMKWIPSATIYPHALVFIAGLPKSGTTWLENLVGCIPQYRRLVCYDPKERLNEHVLDPVLLERIPIRGNFFIKTHIEARPEGVAALQKHHVPTVVMVRDLRDQCVSHFYHILSYPGHPHHEFYRKWDRSRAFTHCVMFSVTEYAEWIRGWLRVLQNDQKLFLLVRYEDIHANVKSQFLRVLNHFSICLKADVLDAIIHKVSKQAGQYKTLENKLKAGNNTLRAGRLGDWRSHFLPTDVEYFKTMANDVLVSLGYEQDSLW